jgi:hypothetical protein
MHLGLRCGDEMFLRAYRRYGPSTKPEAKEEADEGVLEKKRKAVHQASGGSSKKTKM